MFLSTSYESNQRAGFQLSCEIIRLRDKANKFNRLRIQSAQVLMNEEELNVFQSFPLLFHFNLKNILQTLSLKLFLKRR